MLQFAFAINVFNIFVIIGILFCSIIFFIYFQFAANIVGNRTSYRALMGRACHISYISYGLRKLFTIFAQVIKIILYDNHIARGYLILHLMSVSSWSQSTLLSAAPSPTFPFPFLYLTLPLCSFRFNNFNVHLNWK